jgi:hypothetical protein
VPLARLAIHLATGQPDRLPATVPVPTYPVTIRAGEVYIEVKDRFCHAMARTVFETHAQVSSGQTGACSLEVTVAQRSYGFVGRHA